jgi:hypothetical protein
LIEQNMSAEHGVPRRIVIHHLGLERSIAAIIGDGGKTKMTRVWVEVDPQLARLLFNEALHLSAQRSLKINEALTAILTAALVEVLGLPMP